MKTNFLKKALVVMLAMVLAIPAFLGVEAQAEEKLELSDEKMTIGIGSYGEGNGGYYHKKDTRYALYVGNSKDDIKKGATYTFKSGNKKIAKVEADGAVGYITGVKEGTTTITVTQKLNGKTIKGKCKVTVKAAKAELSTVYEGRLGLGKDIIVGGCEVDPLCIIDNYNPEAKYTYKCDNKNFKMSHVKVDAGIFIAEGYTTYAQKYTAKKAGTYKVTVKETYKNKTKTIGTFKVKIQNVKGIVED